MLKASRAQFLDAAKAWKGRAVFPCANKIPAIPTWKETAQPFNNFGAGMATWWVDPRHDGLGLVTGDGLVVLDLDRKNGADGVQALADFASSRNETIPTTLTASTPSGGQHLFFATKAKIGNKIGVTLDGQKLAGVDVRGDGGYVLIAPSVANQGTYSWVNEGTEIAELPGWLETLLTSHKNRQGPKPRTMPIAQGQLDALANAAAEVFAAEPGERNAKLNAVAYSLRSAIAQGKLTQIDVTETLTDAALSAGLGYQEIMTTLQSALANITPSAPEVSNTDAANWLKIAEVFVEYNPLPPRFYHGQWWGYNPQQGVYGVLPDAGHTSIDAVCMKFLGQLVKVSVVEDHEVRHPFGVNNKNVAELKAALKTLDAVGVAELPAKLGENYLVAQNGIVDMNTGNLMPHDPAVFRTWSCAVSYEPAVGDPTFFIERLKAGGLDDAAIKEVAKWIVYLASDGPTKQRIAWIWGEAGGGKSSLVRVFEKLLGDAATTSTFASLANQWTASQLEGKRMVVLPDADVKNTASWLGQSLEMLRNLSGGDKVQVSIKYGAQYAAALDCVPVITSNYSPSLPDSSGALLRRLCAFQFTNKPEWIDGLYEKLDAELPSILAWAVRVGWPALRDEGLINLGATDCEDAREAGSPVLAFADQLLSVDAGKEISNTSIWQAWASWADMNGYNKYSAVWFHKEFKAAFGSRVKSRKSNGKVGYVGIGFKTDNASANVVPMKKAV